MAESSLQRLDSELLRTFLATADTGSFTEAAKRIYRSQSAVSLQIKRLEHLLEQPVFLRERRGVTLTPAGENLRAVAQRVVGLLDDALAELKRNSVEGTLRIAIPDEFGERTLPRVLSRFSRVHPNVKLQVQCGLSSGFRAAFERGEFDIVVFDTDAKPDGSILLRRQRRCWMRSRDHPVHRLDPLPVALFDRACWWSDRAIAALEQAGKNYRVVFSSESVAGVLAAVEAGIAVSVLGTEASSDRLTEVSDEDGLPSMPDSMLVMSYRPSIDSSVIETMSEALRQAFLRQDEKRPRSRVRTFA